MDYEKIGQNIRRLRRAKGLSQEELAERIGISTTHMSHIETANTKLSLPVFVALADALEVSMEDLLDTDTVRAISHSAKEIVTILERCDAKEAKIITDIVKAAKSSMDKNL